MSSIFRAELSLNSKRAAKKVLMVNIMVSAGIASHDSDISDVERCPDAVSWSYNTREMWKWLRRWDDQHQFQAFSAINEDEIGIYSHDLSKGWLRRGPIFLSEIFSDLKEQSTAKFAWSVPSLPTRSFLRHSLTRSDWNPGDQVSKLAKLFLLTFVNIRENWSWWS